MSSQYQSVPEGVTAAPLAGGPCMGGYGSRVSFRDSAPAVKVYHPPQENTAKSPRVIFTFTGAVLLSLLCVVPVWNAALLLQDTQYVFWCGGLVPKWTIGLCVAVVLIYVLTVWTFFGRARLSVHSQQSLMMIMSIFITMMGLVLMLVSMPLLGQANRTYNNLMHRCDYSEQTHRLFEYSQVLQNIRSTPECAKEYSVESCVGYKDAAPYTDFLKDLENNLRCSGFCYRPLAVETPPAEAEIQMDAKPRMKAAPAMRGEVKPHHRSHTEKPLTLATATQHATHHRRVETKALALLAHNLTVAENDDIHADLLGAMFAKPLESKYPPTLFSDANYQASCDGMAARDLQAFASESANQEFFQGLYFVAIAIAANIVKLFSFCTRKEADVMFRPESSIST